jgi:hypothetical protein
MNSIHDHVFICDIFQESIRSAYILLYSFYGDNIPYIFASRNWYEITEIAARYGDILYLDFCHMRGNQLNEMVCAQAAFSGHLDCLRYARENRCPWDANVCLYAARNGHIDCLRYAHENGCPWHEKTAFFARINSKFECLKYCIDNGYPCSDQDRDKYMRLLGPYHCFLFRTQ